MNEKQWTARDRNKTRVYRLVSGRKTVAEFTADLAGANAVFDMFFASGDFASLDLFADTVAPENLACSGNIVSGISP